MCQKVKKKKNTINKWFYITIDRRKSSLFIIPYKFLIFNTAINSLTFRKQHLLLFKFIYISQQICDFWCHFFFFLISLNVYPQ